MDKDRSTIIGLFLIGFIILFTYSDFYKEWVLGDDYEQQAIEAEYSAKKTPDSTTVGMVGREVESATNTTQQELIKPANEPAVLPKIAKDNSKIISIENELFYAEISTVGPSIIDFQLKNYQNGADETKQVNLIHEKQGNITLNIPSKNDTIRFENFNFSYLGTDTINVFSAGQREIVLPFRYYFSDARYVDYVYTFLPDDYSFKLKVNFTNLDQIIDGYKYGIQWAGGIASTEKKLSEDMQYTQVWALTADDIIDKDVSEDEKLNEFNDDWTIRWGAIRNKYFTAAIVPLSQKGSGIKFNGFTRPVDGETFFKNYSFEILMPIMSGNHSDEFLIYMGPLELPILEAYNVNLERMMNLGWKIIRPISKLILVTLKKLYTVIPNYGFVIILFSILVKIVLFPLTRKSFQSMKEMQTIQPEMAALREKYKDNPQKMNTEMMALYKEHGVNPLGGCLPVLFQMPVLYALFTIFRTTIELRGANFIWWITDLSAPDTVYTLPFALPVYGDGLNVLPILMGLTMFFQQKATIQDPKQKAMVYFMPIIFTYMFNSFPSGLTLYYTLFNLFSMLQQKFAPAPAKKPDQNRNGKKTKKPKSKLDFYRQQAELRKKK
ncbi:MAG: membrane protein insertase YidC [Calditrichaeota bacterium]|nr:MAG: membrane protein insertase YidC [Calditrichota bacterium]